MLESIEKLREWRNTPDNGYWADEVTEHADEIEREISERYMPLPVDADGMPIHMGDTVEGELPDNTTVKGAVTTYHIHDDDYPDTVYIKVDCGGVWTIKELRIKRCRHVKPRTVEDVLSEFGNECADNCGVDPDDLANYADRLRKLLGGETE